MPEPDSVRPKPVTPKGISPARAMAFDILERVALTDAHSDDLLRQGGMSALSQPDRDLTTALVLGVLRWQIALDARLRTFLSRPDVELALPVRLALRLGAFQLLHLERIPAHAAVHESVELARAAGQAHAAGMVNAILRKLVAAAAPRRPILETGEAMAERLGHPAWLTQRWVRSYGRPAAEAICGSDQQQPASVPLFAEGPTDPHIDPGSRLVAELAAWVGREADSVWDCCAAPGGKTLVLAERLDGAELLATDVSPGRLERLRTRLREQAAGQEIRTERVDLTTDAAALGSFDLVLCDVPCSGTGTLARNPEIRHRLQPADLSWQARRQVAILRNALRQVRPGGHLVYSTCSLEPEENQAVVDAVLGSEPGFVQQDVTPMLAEMVAVGRLAAAPEVWPLWVREKTLRTLPGYGFTGDGFYAAVLAHAGS